MKRAILSAVNGGIQASVRLAAKVGARVLRKHPGLKAELTTTLVGVLASMPDPSEEKIEVVVERKVRHVVSASPLYSGWKDAHVVFVGLASAALRPDVDRLQNQLDGIGILSHDAYLSDCSHDGGALSDASDLAPRDWLTRVINQYPLWRSLVVVDVNTGYVPSLLAIKKLLFELSVRHDVVGASFVNRAHQTSTTLADASSVGSIHLLNARVWGLNRGPWEATGGTLRELSGTPNEVATQVSVQAFRTAARLLNVLRPGEADEAVSEEPIDCPQCMIDFGFTFPEYRYLLRHHRRTSLERSKLLPGLSPAVPRKARVLFVQPIPGGGLPKTHDMISAEIARDFEVFRLVSSGRKFSIYAGSDRVIPIFEGRLSLPVNGLSHNSGEYDYLFFSALTELGIDLVHVEHLAWQSLGIERVCTLLNIPLTFSLHDYYSVCSSNNLLDENLTFCGGKCTPGVGACQTPLWPKNEFLGLKNGSIKQWQDGMLDFLSGCSRIFSPSESAANVLLGVFPTLREKVLIVPHPAMGVSKAVAPGAYAGEGPVRVLIIGDLGPHKGENRVFQLLSLDPKPALEYHLVGPERFLLHGIDVTYGEYSQSDLPAIIAGIAPHIALLPSVAMETFSHALSELWGNGVPVVAFSGSGAVEDRINTHGGGIVLQADQTPSNWAEEMISFASDSAAYGRAQHEIAQWRRGVGSESVLDSVRPYFTEFERLTAR
jgi:hypothetical protein